MKKVNFVFFNILLLSLLSCKESKSKENIVNESISIDTTTVQSATDDKDEVHQVVVGFLKWYKSNYRAIDSIVLVPNSRDTILDNYYSVDFINLDKYIKKLQSSGYLSNTYLNSIRNHVKEANSKMLNEKQNDGPPEGLNYDLILHTQEVDESLSKIDNIEPYEITINGDVATAKVKLAYELSFSLKKINNKWFIEK